MNTIRWPKISNGFSLVEMIVAVSIIAILSVIVINFLITGTKVQDAVMVQSTDLISARQTLLKMAATVREASDGDDGGYPIAAASATSLIIYSNIDSDSAIEQVTYQLDNTQLKQTVINPSGSPVKYQTQDGVTTILADGINNGSTGHPVFTYYNSDYPADQVTNPLAAPINLQAITLININLEYNTQTEKTMVQLRNLKTNL